MPPMLRLASTVTVRPAVSVKPNVAMSAELVAVVEPGMTLPSQFDDVDQVPALLVFHEPSAARPRGPSVARHAAARQTARDARVVIVQRSAGTMASSRTQQQRKRHMERPPPKSAWAEMIPHPNKPAKNHR